MNANGSSARLAILDGFALVHRAYFAGKDRPLSVRRTGEVTTAVFGFANTLLSVLRDLQPSHIAVAMDMHGPTFRHLKADTYKAHRPAMPDELRNQFARVRELIGAFNIPIYEAEGFEADDVLGTLARQARDLGAETYLVTLDSDILQLVQPGVFCYMYRLYQHDTMIFDAEKVIERYGVRPDQIPDLKGLKGDSSDNIAGVPGIGEKTAVKLIQGFGSVAGVYEHLAEVKPPRLRDLLTEHAALAEHSREMATIVTDAPVELSLANTRTHDFDRRKVEALFHELEFRSMLDRLPGSTTVGAEPLGLETGDDSERLRPLDYATISTAEQLDAVVAKVRSARRLAFDTETTGTNAMLAGLVGISLSWAAGEACYIPVGHLVKPQDAEQFGLGLEGSERQEFTSLDEPPAQLPVETVIDRLRPLFDDPAIEKIAHNAKYDLIVLANAGLDVARIDSDTMIAAYLLGDRRIDLKSLAYDILKAPMTEISALIGSGTKQKTMAQVPIADAAAYAAADADMTGRLQSVVETEVANRGLFELYRDIELPLVPVLLAMERRGIALDPTVLREMSRTLTEELTRVEAGLYAEVGHQFNLGSPKQLSAVLFEELKLPPTRKTNLGYTTDAQALEGLRGHPVVDQILEYRQLSKLKSTYVDALPGMINPRTGRLHTSYNQTNAATGRLSSSDPNLQNIPVRTELGRGVRRAFIAADPDDHREMCLFAADYSQVELRILAHITQEPRLVDAFRADQDIHKATASDIFGIPIAEVSADQRRLAKTVNFAVIYGLSAVGLSQRTELSRSEAAAFIRAYFERYPGIKSYLDETVATTRRQGYAATLLGRRRYLPDINNSNVNLRQSAERMATNHPIQGTNADIIKIAMNRIAAALPAHELASRMLLQVHDELIFEGPREELPQLSVLVIELMSSAMTLSVPLRVEVKSGSNWGEME